MSVFFNGRLWVSPATMSVVDDSAMFNANPNVGNVVALLGESSAGAPQTPLTFGSAQDARTALISGELLTAVAKAFDPSADTAGPATVIAIRVNPALQSALTLNDGTAAASINLVSQDYGQYTNQIAVKVESGTLSGKKLTTQLGTAYFSGDNIGIAAFSVQYTGTSTTATMSVTDTTVTLFADTTTAIDLNSFSTVGQLVDRINAVTGFTAAVLNANDNLAALNGLDGVASQDVKTALYTARADLQACVNWFNGTAEGYVTATRATGAAQPPADIPFTYLAGGTDGVPATQDWQNAFDALQTVDVQWVVPVSSDPAVQAMASTHVDYMSNVARMERRCIVGPDIGTTDAEAITAALTFNDNRVSYTHLGYYDFDVNGNLTLFPPYMMAALLAGMFSGVNPGTALTNKSIKVQGLERNLRNPTDTDPLILGGVLCVDSETTGYKVVKSISTWLVNTAYDKVEVSCGVALDFVSRNVRNTLDELRGAKGTPIVLSQAVSRVDSVLRALAVPDPVGPGVIVGDAKNPAYKNIQASLSGDVLNVQFQCSPVIPVNYIPVSIFAVPYSGTASS